MPIRITTQQVAFLLFLQLLGSAMIYVPESTVGRNAWISTLLASLAGLYILQIIIRLQMMFPGISLLQLSELAMGSVAGKILNAIYLWVVFDIAMLYLYETTNFLRIIYPYAPQYFFRTLLILAAAYCLYKGVVPIARLGEAVIWLVLASLILSLLTPLNLVKPQFLLPILSQWKPVVGGILIGIYWPYSEITIFALLLPFVTDLKENSRQLYIWYGLAVLALLLRTLLSITVLGPEHLAISSFPFYEVMRQVSLQNFQRVELFFLAMWITTGFSAGLVYYLGLMLGLKQLFNLQSYRTLILPMGLLLVVMSIYRISSDFYLFAVLTPADMLQNITVDVLYPTIVLLAAILGYKKVRQKLGNSSNTAEQPM